MAYTITRREPDAARAAVLEVWRQVLTDLDAPRFDWIYRDNPAGPAACWTAEGPDGAETVGCTALFPRKIQVGSRSLTAGIAGDLAVLPAHRGFGPALPLQKNAVGAVGGDRFAFLYGVPNSSSAPILKRAGYEVVGALMEMACLLRSRDYLARHMPRWLASALAPPLDAALRVRGWTRRVGPDPDHHGDDVPELDRRLDTFWDELGQRNTGVIGVRDSDFLRWRFTRAPSGEYRAFALTERRTDRLIGYVVYQTVDGRTVVEDLAALDLEASLDSLLHRFVAHQRSRRAAAIAVRFLGPPALVRGLRRAGFRVREPDAGPVVAFIPRGLPEADLIRDPDNWWFFDADNDT